MLELLKRLFGKKKGMRQCNADPPHEENYQPKKEVDKKEEWENLKYIQIYGTTTKELAESVQRCIESMNNFNSEVIVESIKNSATRTAIIMSHVDTMISLYHTYCERAENSDIEMRRYDVLWDRYLADEPLNVESISKKHHMTKQNVYADLKIATERLTALIFGVDGLSVR